MNRQEREEYVIQLYKEGKSIRQIAELVHMSFRDIGTVTKKVKLQADRERAYINDDVDMEAKSKEAQAFKLFSSGKSPIEVAIALDLEAGRVRAIYRDYWELSGRYKLAQIYDEARYDLDRLLRLHKTVKDLRMGEHEITKVFELAKHNQLELLQWKVEYLAHEVTMLESQKAKATNDILKLNRTIDQMQTNMQNRGGMAYMNQQWGWSDNTDNLYPIPYSEPSISSYSIGLYYRDYRPWQ
jgi:hypothetical protein